tara:strand:- start:9 stop:368 length:360 start_codon:yes stop_codon:yes gene_type:complete
MIIFHKNGQFHAESSVLPNEEYLDTNLWTIAELPEGEIYDFKYSYTQKDGVAIKGDLIPVDTDEINKLEAEAAATQYARDRKAEYDLLDQDEMRFDDQVNGTTTWVDAIKAIKAKYPKP